MCCFERLAAGDLEQGRIIDDKELKDLLAAGDRPVKIRTIGPAAGGMGDRAAG